MGAYSSNEIKSLGKRLRDGSRSLGDIKMLETYRSEFDPLLLETAFNIDELLSKDKIEFLISGRSKRTKSIIRKIQRPENHGMDLSRISDIVGLRIIARDIALQDKIILLLKNSIPLKPRIYDYRNENKIYRSVHLISYKGSKLIEIQLRTVIQHLWADESESFGEPVKEGSGSTSERSYLSNLSKACKMLEDGTEVSESDFPGSLMKNRTPISGKLKVLNGLFDGALQEYHPHKVGTSYIIIYDNHANELLKEYMFTIKDRDYAVKEYHNICRNLDDTRYEVLILNSLSRAALAVTHSRFFPEAI